MVYIMFLQNVSFIGFVCLLLCIIFFLMFCTCGIGASKIICVQLIFWTLRCGAYENIGLVFFFWGPAWTSLISVDDSSGCNCQRNPYSSYISEWDPSSWQWTEIEIKEQILLDLNFFRILKCIFLPGISYCSNFLHLYIIWDTFMFQIMYKCQKFELPSVDS